VLLICAQERQSSLVQSRNHPVGSDHTHDRRLEFENGSQPVLAQSALAKHRGKVVSGADLSEGSGQLVLEPLHFHDNIAGGEVARVRDQPTRSRRRKQNDRQVCTCGFHPQQDVLCLDTGVVVSMTTTSAHAAPDCRASTTETVSRPDTRTCGAILSSFCSTLCASPIQTTSSVSGAAAGVVGTGVSVVLEGVDEGAGIASHTFSVEPCLNLSRCPLTDSSLVCASGTAR
jgi:hypothetical protein